MMWNAMSPQEFGAQQAALAMMKPGNTVRQAVEAARTPGTKRSLPLQGGPIGHGMGMDDRERPLPAAKSDAVITVDITFKRLACANALTPLRTEQKGG